MEEKGPGSQVKQFQDIGEPEDRLCEEMGEVLQALAKAKRFGYFNFHPERPHKTNIDELRYELVDLMKAINTLDDHLSLIQRIRDAGTDHNH